MIIQQKQIKLLILGNSQVGKTALLNRFSENKFQQTTTTTGMGYGIKQIKIDDKEIKLSVWDTAGQERYQTITFSLYKESQGVILAFDLTSAQTFQTLDNWIRLIRENINDGFQLALVGTKCDLTDQIVVTKEMIQQFLDQNNLNIDYYETSALQNINVFESFIGLATKVYNANPIAYQPIDLNDLNNNNGNNNQSTILNNKPKEQSKDKCC